MKVEGILKGDRNSLVSYVSLSVHRVCRAPPPFGRGPHTRDGYNGWFTPWEHGRWRSLSLSRSLVLPTLPSHSLPTLRSWDTREGRRTEGVWNGRSVGVGRYGERTGRTIWTGGNLTPSGPYDLTSLRPPSFHTYLIQLGTVIITLEPDRRHSTQKGTDRIERRTCVWRVLTERLWLWWERNKP